MESPKRAILLLTNHHLGSEFPLNILLTTSRIEITGVVVSPPAKGVAHTLKCIKKMGLLHTAMLFIQHGIKSLILKFNALRSQGSHIKYLTTIRKAALARKIPVLHVNDINKEEVVNFIQGNRPDLLISAFYSQILSEHVLKIPVIGAVNIHPGDIEHYRGVMNYFWVIRNNERATAATVHWMDAGIDTGVIIARAPVPIGSKDTQFAVLRKTATQGAATLIQQIPNLKRCSSLHVQTQGRYYTIPGSSDFQVYIKSRRFFN
jgi:methionyl-tRNA formyltransferase